MNDQPLSTADKRFNFAACLTDAVGWPLGAALFSQTTILPIFLRHLGAGNTTIGCLPALYNLLVFLPGLLVVGFIGRLPRARGFLLFVALIERFALLLLVPMTLLWGHAHPGWLLAGVFGAISLHAGAMGLNQPAYWVVIGKCVPAAWRGRLFGYAGGVAGVLGIGMDGLLRRLLSGPNGGFPHGYALGFLIGFVILFLSCIPLGLVHEPLGKSRADDDPHTGHYLRDIGYVWRTNTSFRRFLYGQIALTLASLAVPFYVLYAQRHLHAGTGSVAGYTASIVLVTAFGGLALGAWSDRSGNKIVLLISCVFAMAASVIALLAVSPLLFYGVFIALALALAGAGIAGNNIVMEYAGSPREIPLYTAMYNAITALPRAAAPLLGGLLADHAGGYLSLFILSALLSLLALVLTLRAGDPRHETAAV
ncbi:MAG: MFS transporter [Janthinobacterium lividum]